MSWTGKFKLGDTVRTTHGSKIGTIIEVSQAIGEPVLYNVIDADPSRRDPLALKFLEGQLVEYVPDESDAGPGDQLGGQEVQQSDIGALEELDDLQRALASGKEHALDAESIDK